MENGLAMNSRVDVTTRYVKPWVKAARGIRASAAVTGKPVLRGKSGGMRLGYRPGGGLVFHVSSSPLTSTVSASGASRYHLDVRQHPYEGPPVSGDVPDGRPSRRENRRSNKQRTIAIMRTKDSPLGLTGTPSPAMITMVNNVISRYQAVRERAQPVAGEHPSIRRIREQQ